MTWIVTASLIAARTSFDIRFPRRDKRSDGTIGDPRHQQSPSGHNPDDTPGSLPESEDTDNVAEVRAIDIDADLNAPGVSMADVVAAILATPQDRDRLLYIIYNNVIWSKSHRWVPRRYYGDNPHTTHVHLSGDPAFDNDGRLWTSILTVGRKRKMGNIIALLQANGIAALYVHPVTGRWVWTNAVSPDLVTALTGAGVPLVKVPDIGAFGRSAHDEATMVLDAIRAGTPINGTVPSEFVNALRDAAKRLSDAASSLH